MIKKQKGVTLLEMLMVIVVSSLIMTTSIKLYQTVQMNQKIDATLNTLGSVIVAMDQYLNTYGTYQNLVLNNLTPYLPNQVIPSSSFGGVLVVAGTSANTYTITVPGITAAPCVALRSLLVQNNKYSPVCTNTQNSNQMVITVSQ